MCHNNRAEAETSLMTLLIALSFISWHSFCSLTLHHEYYLFLYLSGRSLQNSDFPRQLFQARIGTRRSLSGVGRGTGFRAPELLAFPLHEIACLHMRDPGARSFP